jgi:hypothetical protein
MDLVMGPIYGPVEFNSSHFSYAAQLTLRMTVILEEGVLLSKPTTLMELLFLYFRQMEFLYVRSPF